MARPKKKALDYFPFDVDFFGDDKIKAVASEFNIKGEIVAVKLLCAIYSNGYFVEWNETTRTKMLGELRGISEGLLDQIVERLAKRGFFDKSLLDSANILTSHGIQKRYFEVVKRCRRQVESDKLPYLLVKSDDIVSYGGNEVNARGNEVNVEGNPTNKKETKVSHSRRTLVSSEIGNLKKDETWTESICMMFHLSPDEVPPLLDAFALEYECRGRSEHYNLQAVKSSFTSWMMSRKTREAKAGKSGEGRASELQESNTSKHKWQSANDIWIPKSERPEKRERRWQS